MSSHLTPFFERENAMDLIKKLWWLAFPIGYVVIGLITGIVIAVNGHERPIIGGLLWPIRIIKDLLT